MTKLIKKVKGNATEYRRKDGTLKYRHYTRNGFEFWDEYDSGGNWIYMKNSYGREWWSFNNPNNPKNKVEEVGVEVEESDIRPFEFSLQTHIVSMLRHFRQKLFSEAIE